MESIKKAILIRIRLAALPVLLFAGAVGARIYYIQLYEGDKWRRISQQTTFDYRKVKATRGNIYSDNGSLLATSIPFYRVAFDPELASESVFEEGIDSLSLLLARYYKDKSAADYRRMIRDARLKDRQYLTLNRKRINYQTKKTISSWPIFRKGKYAGGIIFEKSDVRYHPFASLCARTVGFVNENSKGAGLEYSFNALLKGVDGEALFQKLPGGVWRPMADANNLKSIDGLDIVSTIDVNLQDVAQTSLHRAMENHQADEGCVAVMEVKTGHIKALANLTRVGDRSYEQFNHAIGGLYEPGSTFKLVTMMALLDKGYVDLADTVDIGSGVWTLYGHKIQDHDASSQSSGKISVQRAFERSSNVAMAKLLDRYFGKQPAAFLEYVDRLALSRPLHLQILGEGKPKIKRPHDKEWSRITLPWMAHGYGFEITPLHTLTLFNALANEGVMVKPMFVTAALRADKVEKRYEPETMVDKICSEKTMEQLRTLLEGVSLRGTAKNLLNANYNIAGKTGTSVILQDGAYVNKYIASFVGYFPAHAPRYTIIVLIKNPKGAQQHGNDVAGPVFKEIADNIYAHDTRMHAPMPQREILQAGVFPVIQAGRQADLTLLCNTLGISNHSAREHEWARAARQGSAVLWRANEPTRGKTPDVRGMTLRDALFLLEKSGMHVRYTGIGRVTEQHPDPAFPMVKGQEIQLSLSQ